MIDSLFRQEAVLASAGSKFGSGVFYQPISSRLMVIVASATFLCFLAFATVAQIKQTERVRGYLASQEGEIKVYGSRAGILGDVLYSDGDVVSRGDVLATVLDAQFDGEGIQSSEEALAKLDEQISQLHARIQVLKKKSALNLAQFQSRVAGYESELVLLTDEHQIVLQQLRLSLQEYEGSEILYLRGSISSREHNQVMSKWYDLQQRSKSSLMNVEAKRLALIETQHQIELQPLSLEDEILLLKSTISQLDARRSELKAQALFSITAPGHGTISNFIFNSGDYIDPRVPVMTLVPVDSYLEAQLYLPGRSLGKVKLDQKIMLSYDAYSYQTYGTFEATITSIAETVIDPREFLVPLDLKEPVFLVKAAIDRQSAPGSSEQTLRPGLQFSADIVTGSESILERLLSPLRSLGRKL